MALILKKCYHSVMLKRICKRISFWVIACTGTKLTLYWDSTCSLKNNFYFQNWKSFLSYCLLPLFFLHSQLSPCVNSSPHRTMDHTFYNLTFCDFISRCLPLVSIFPSNQPVVRPILTFPLQKSNCQSSVSFNDCLSFFANRIAVFPSSLSFSGTTLSLRLCHWLS